MVGKYRKIPPHGNLVPAPEYVSYKISSNFSPGVYPSSALPQRLARVFRAYVNTLHTNNVETSLKNMLNGQTLRQFMHPALLTTSLFPHMSQSLSRPHILGIVTSPVTYARQECRNRRRQLERLCDERARQLGQLIRLSRTFGGQKQRGEMCRFTIALHSVIVDDQMGESLEDTVQPAESDIPVSAVLTPLHDFLSTALPEQNALNAKQFDKSRRPSRLTLLWPRLVIVPPLTLISLKFLYSSRISIRTYAEDAVATIRGFWTGWVIEPIKGIVNTIRSGGMEGAIISKDGLKSDLDVCRNPSSLIPRPDRTNFMEVVGADGAFFVCRETKFWARPARRSCQAYSRRRSHGGPEIVRRRHEASHEIGYLRNPRPHRTHPGPENQGLCISPKMNRCAPSELQVG